MPVEKKLASMSWLELVLERLVSCALAYESDIDAGFFLTGK